MSEDSTPDFDRSSNQQPAKRWRPCPWGVIAEVAGRSADCRRRQILQSAATVTGWLTICGGLFAWFVSPQYELAETAESHAYSPLPPRDHLVSVHSISCRDTLRYFEEYAEGELEPEQATRISVHLDRCPTCYRHFQLYRSHPRDQSPVR